MAVLTTGLVRLVGTDAHEGPAYFPHEDAVDPRRARPPARRGQPHPGPRGALFVTTDTAVWAALPGTEGASS